MLRQAGGFTLSLSLDRNAGLHLRLNICDRSFAALNGLSMESSSKEKPRSRASFCSGCMSRIPAGSEVFIKVIEALHILCGNFKVKNIGIFEDAFMIGRFGNHHQSVLQRPADEDLRR